MRSLKISKNVTERDNISLNKYLQEINKERKNDYRGGRK